MTERQPYELIQSYPGFELRHYPSGIQIETLVGGDFLSAGNRGFGPLVNFISGFNQRRQRIAMTAPVIQQTLTGNKHSVRFVLPKDMDLSNTPKAADPRVKIIEVPEHFAAARVFSGSWNEQRFMQQGEALVSALLTERLEPIGSVYFSRFDPPWKPGFLKRNEVLIQVKR